MAAVVSVPAGVPPPGLAPRLNLPWHLRLRDGLSAYLPLLLMLLLALATWWLVKNSPRVPSDEPARAARSEPDYTMSGFVMQRFDAQGRLTLRIEGSQMRHFPDTDRIEVEQVRISATAPDGRQTLAHARRALANGDGSEVQLLGEAEVSSQQADGSALWMRGEFLHAFLVTEQVRSHLPVLLRLGGAELRVAGLDYDHAARKLELKGPMRGVWPPQGAKK